MNGYTDFCEFSGIEIERADLGEKLNTNPQEDQRSRPRKYHFSGLCNNHQYLRNHFQTGRHEAQRKIGNRTFLDEFDQNWCWFAKEHSKVTEILREISLIIRPSEWTFANVPIQWLFSMIINEEGLWIKVNKSKKNEVQNASYAMRRFCVVFNSAIQTDYISTSQRLQVVTVVKLSILDQTIVSGRVIKYRESVSNR